MKKIICEVLGTEPEIFQRYFYFPAPCPPPHLGFLLGPPSFLLFTYSRQTPQTWAASLPEMTLQSSHQQCLANNIFVKGISITLDKAMKTFLPMQGVSPQGPASLST